MLSQSQLAEKLGVHPRTIANHVFQLKARYSLSQLGTQVGKHRKFDADEAELIGQSIRGETLPANWPAESDEANGELIVYDGELADLPEPIETVTSTRKLSAPPEVPIGKINIASYDLSDDKARLKKYEDANIYFADILPVLADTIGDRDGEMLKTRYKQRVAAKMQEARAEVASMVTGDLLS